MPISGMSATWSISEKSVWFLLTLSGFLLMVAIEIGSLAHLTCFCRVVLSSIFWSNSKPCSQNFVYFFEKMVLQFFIYFLVTSIICQVVQLLIRVEHQKSHFCIHFLFIIWLFSVELVCCNSSSSREHSLFCGNAILSMVECFNLDKWLNSYPGWLWLNSYVWMDFGL